MPSSQITDKACRCRGQFEFPGARLRNGQPVGLYSLTMTTCKRLFCLFLLLALLGVSSRVFAQAVPPINQCRRNWTVNTTQDLDFGGFSVEAGSATITMNSSGGRSTTGLVSLSTSTPASTWRVDISNTLDPDCATYGFSLDLAQPPRPLTGPGTRIPFDNVRISVPAYGLNNVTLPQVIAPSPGNSSPFTVTIYGEITVTNPQAAGEYTRRHVFEFMQSVRRMRTNTTVSATSIVPLSIAETASMDFGTIAAGPVPGTVILGVGNSRTATGDVQLLAAGPGSAATFQLTGEPNQTYALTFGDGILANAGGQQMSVTTFTDNSAGTIPAAGADSFRVGATLNVGSGQQAGYYSTTNGSGSPYTVTINYN